VTDPNRPILGYANRRERSPVLERRRALVRRAARQYLLVIAIAFVLVPLAGLLIALCHQC
jgi:hypothetical protein